MEPKFDQRHRNGFSSEMDNSFIVKLDDVEQRLGLISAEWDSILIVRRKANRLYNETLDRLSALRSKITLKMQENAKEMGKIMSARRKLLTVSVDQEESLDVDSEKLADIVSWLSVWEKENNLSSAQSVLNKIHKVNQHFTKLEKSVHLETSPGYQGHHCSQQTEDSESESSPVPIFKWASGEYSDSSVGFNKRTTMAKYPVRSSIQIIPLNDVPTEPRVRSSEPTVSITAVPDAPAVSAVLAVPTVRVAESKRCETSPLNNPRSQRRSLPYRFKCTICGKEFKRRKFYMRHTFGHASTEPHAKKRSVFQEMESR